MITKSWFIVSRILDYLKKFYMYLNPCVSHIPNHDIFFLSFSYLFHAS